MEEGRREIPVPQQSSLCPLDTEQWSNDVHTDGKHLLKSKLDDVNFKPMVKENHETNQTSPPLLEIAVNYSEEYAEVVLPQLLEKVLVLKFQREHEVVIDDIINDIEHQDTLKIPVNEDEWDEEENVILFYIYVGVHLIKDTFLQINITSHEVENEKNKHKAVRGKKKRKKKKKKKSRNVEEQKNNSDIESETTPDVEIE